MLPLSIRQSALIVVLLLPFGSAHAQQLLFITNNSSLTSDEQSYKSQFESWGYTVTTIVDTDSQSTYDSALSSSDVVFVSEDVLSSSVSYKLRETTVGVVSSEGWLDNELGFSTSNPFTSSASQIYVLNNSHDVSAGMSTGYVSIFSSSQYRVLMNGTEAAGINILATSSGGDTVLATLDVGAQLANTYNGNSTAAGRRVRLPWGDGSFSYSSLNSTGLDLMQRALQWAASSGTSGFLLHLRLDESSGTTASDSSGSNNHGIYVNTPLQGEPAIRRTGAEFTSNNDYVYVPTSSSLDMVGEADGDFTVAFWVKPYAFTGNWRPLFHKGDSNYTRGPGLWLRPSDNRVLYRLSTTHSWNEGSDSSGVLEFDKWNHVTLAKSASTLTFYINGKLDRTTYLVGTSVGNTGGLYLGDSPWYPTSDCAIDDVRVFNRALSASEIAEIHGLVGQWQLDETSGTTAYDSSGSGDDGTYTGGVSLNEVGPGSGVASIAAQFDGNNDYVDLPSMQHSFSDGFAASMWVKVNSIPSSGSWHAFFSIANGTYRDEIWVGWRKDYGLYFYGTDQTNGSNWESVSDFQDFALGSWTHVIVNIDPDGYATLYQNGTATTSEEFVSLPTNVFRNFAYIADSVWDENFDGLLHDVQLYNRPLTSEEIADLSSANQSGTGIRIQSWVEIQ